MRQSQEKQKVLHEKLNKESGRRRLKLALYDLIIILLALVIVLVLNPSHAKKFTAVEFLLHFLMVSGILIGFRFCFSVYSQIWRYSRTISYLRLGIADILGQLTYILLCRVLPINRPTTVAMMTICLLSLVGSAFLRYLYTVLFEIIKSENKVSIFFRKGSRSARVINNLILHITGINCIEGSKSDGIPVVNKIRIAIIGAGRLGVMLAEELLCNPEAVYTPVCFIDIDQQKIGRRIMNIPVLSAGKDTKENLGRFSVQEVVFALSRETVQKKELYEQYKKMGFKVKVYTFPIENSVESGKRQIREFDIEELLFRQETDFLNDETRNFYKNKVVMVTGGGGSIGSELCRQLAKMGPKKLIILDIYENNAYDVQQELKLVYGSKLDLQVEIASVRDKQQVEKVFSEYHPDIVLHAAAHKHVPLMEHNCSEAVKNNVFGTWNVVNAAEKFGVKKFIMVSTDKAVNPTNVMGASKRMCEMLVLSRAAQQKKTSFSCTRFGNVLGSNGSVIPLFKRQISNGGPITITDKRIIRYFMTIPEASQLVLTSGAMAKSGELFVLDMGRPVKILDLAENMIRLSGFEPYKDIDIQEIGLRPGEKLFEELLIQTEKLTKTDNSMIFVERDEPITHKEVVAKLERLKEALKTENDDQIRLAMKEVVPTFHSPQHVNKAALESGKYNQEAAGNGSQAAAV